MKKDNAPNNTTIYMPIFMCIGISVGMAIGVPFGNIPIGMCIGVGLGTCIGGIIDHKNRKKSQDNSSDDKPEE
ncbi:MAG: hypothetical protein E7648_05800 [Ruminococcaceae bacterium]|nr:hypothetical protein [Oscillospiraceae bacterium]